VGKGPVKEMPFLKVAGLLKGQVHFTDADIEAAKVRSRDLSE
jgi:hypothetical protein